MPRPARPLFLALLMLLAVPLLRAQGPGPARAMRKPSMDDTIRAHVDADDWFMLWVNGEVVTVDPIAFIPHDVVAVDLPPSSPMTITALAKDDR